MTRWFGILAAVLVLAVACSNPDDVTSPSLGALSQAVTCQVSVPSQSMTCESPSPSASRGLEFNVVMGGPQGRYVTLASSGTTYNSGPQTLTSSVTVQNMMSQPMGTNDGSTTDPNGTRVFFWSGPHVTGGTGTVTVTGDNTATFTAPNQPYYQYDAIIAAGATSSAKMWTFNVPSTVTSFSFGVMVSTRLPNEAVATSWTVASAPARFPTLDLYHASAARGQVWASGANGTIFHYTDAGGWVVDTTGMTGADTIMGCPGTCGKPAPVYSIVMYPDTAGLIGGWAVGGSGSGIRLAYDGAQWNRQSSGTSTLVSVGMVGTSPNAEFWACGLGGVLYHAYQPNHFTRFTSFTTPVDLYSCSGTASTNVFVAGTGGYLAHYTWTDGSFTTTGYTSNTTETINAATYCFDQSGSATDMWLAGSNGMIRHSTVPFTTFAAQPSGTTETLYGIDAASCTDVYAVGSNGTILHYDGASWSPQTSGTISLLSSVVVRTKVDGTRDAWVVGHAGTILHGTR